MSLPESQLKKRATKLRVAEQKTQESRKQKQQRRQSRRVAFRHAASFVKEYKSHEAQEHRLNRQAREEGNFYVPETARLLAVVRIRGINDMHPKSRKILQLLRLRQLNNMVFVKLTKATMNMIRKVEPYVAYGYPSLKTVREVIYKRGHGKVDKQRLPLTDNSLIEAQLGEHGIICMEDLIHEIYTVGPHFKEASNFLWPIKLSNLSGGSTKKGTHYIEGGEAGMREKAINDMIARMN